MNRSYSRENFERGRKYERVHRELEPERIGSFENAGFAAWRALESARQRKAEKVSELMLIVVVAASGIAAGVIYIVDAL